MELTFTPPGPEGCEYTNHKQELYLFSCPQKESVKSILLAFQVDNLWFILQL